MLLEQHFFSAAAESKVSIPFVRHRILGDLTRRHPVGYAFEIICPFRQNMSMKIILLLLKFEGRGTVLK